MNPLEIELCICKGIYVKLSKPEKFAGGRDDRYSSHLISKLMSQKLVNLLDGFITTLFLH